MDRMLPSGQVTDIGIGLCKPSRATCLLYTSVKAGDHRNNDITQILVGTRERGGLLGLRLGERSGLRLVALAETDSEHLVGSIHAVLNILRVVQVLQNTLAEGDAVLIDEDVRGSVGVDVDNLKVDIRKIDCHNYSFLSS